MKRELQDMLDECAAELDDIEVRIDSLPSLDKGIRYFTNYALIKACGTVEFVYRSIVADHFSNLENSRIDTYLDTTIRKGSMSAKYDMMRNLLGKFDEQWKKDFQEAVNARSDKNKLIAASDSLVTNRHAFAHGKSPTATFLDIKQYYIDVVELIRILDSTVR
jgi:hypothetical protein